MEGINSPSGVLRPQHYYHQFWCMSQRWLSPSPPPSSLEMLSRLPRRDAQRADFECTAKAPLQTRPGFLLDGDKDPTEIMFPVLWCCPVLALMLLGPDHQKLLLQWDNKPKCSCITLCCYSWSFTHILYFCSLDTSFCVHHSVLTFIYFYRKCYKAQPKNTQSFVAYLSVWKQELIASIFFFTHSLKKSPQILLCAASQCPSEDSDAPACAEELFWGLPVQFCSSQSEEMRKLWMHSGHVPSKGHAY